MDKTIDPPSYYSSELFPNTDVKSKYLRAFEVFRQMDGYPAVKSRTGIHQIAWENIDKQSNNKEHDAPVIRFSSMGKQT